MYPPSTPTLPAIDAAPLNTAIALCAIYATLFVGVEITQHPTNITFTQWFWLLAMSCCFGTMLGFVAAAILFTQVGVYLSVWSTVEGGHR